MNIIMRIIISSTIVTITITPIIIIIFIIIIIIIHTIHIGAPWTNDNHVKFNRTSVCGLGSPCLITEKKYGSNHFSVGPPYMVHKKDMTRIAKSWTTFVPRLVRTIVI